MKENLSLRDFTLLINGKEKITLSSKDKERVRKSRSALKAILKANPDRLYYGINTGVGALLYIRIP